MNDTWAWLGVLRGRFLLLTVSCVALGVALGFPFADFHERLTDAGLVLAGALSAHAAVNALNECNDFRSGLDLRTQRTPFSGGSGTLVRHPHLLRHALALGLGSLLICALAGIALLVRQPHLLVTLLPLGLLGLALVVAYTPWITRQPALCLLAPGCGFGLMVLGTYQVLAPTGDWTGTWLVAVPFLLTNCLLLLNQLPDINADRSVGRRTLPMLIGIDNTVRVAAAHWLLAYGVLAAALLSGSQHGAAWGLPTAPLAVAAYGLLRQTGGLHKALALNAAISVATPLLMAAGLVFTG